MQYSRCGHFTLEVEELFVSGAAVMMRVPIRRCALAERMIALISQTEKGRDVARKLRIEQQGSTGQEEAATLVRAAFGPDLEAIHSSECTANRCLESCTPSYKAILLQFAHGETADREKGAGCIGTETLTGDALGTLSTD